MVLSVVSFGVFVDVRKLSMICEFVKWLMIGLLCEVSLWIVGVSVVVFVCCLVLGRVWFFVILWLNGVFFLWVVIYFDVVLMI